MVEVDKSEASSRRNGLALAAGNALNRTVSRQHAHVATPVWTLQERGEITLDTTAGPINVNRHVVANNSEGAVVLYWYQTPRRVIAGEMGSEILAHPGCNPRNAPT